MRTMRITMKTLYASADRSVAPGQTAEFPIAEATALIDGGYAVAAPASPAEPAEGPAAVAATRKQRSAAKASARKGAKTDPGADVDDPGDHDPAGDGGGGESTDVPDA